MLKTARFFNFLLVFAVLYLCQINTSASQTRTQKNAQAYQKICEGNLLTENGQYQDAIQAYQKAVALNPKNPKPYYYISFLYAELSAFEKAISYAEKSLQHTPLYPEAHALLGAISFIVTI